jgi:hypothetical protein
MSLERALHERWQTMRPLDDLVPAQRVATGLALAAGAMPYVTLSRLGDEQTTRTSSKTRFTRTRVRWTVWHDALDLAAEIATAIERAYGGLEVAWVGGRVLDMRLASRGQVPQDDGTRATTLDYDVVLEHSGE